MSSFVQRSFAAGEVTPSVWGRCDTTKYQSGLKQCRNTMIPRQGGSTSRPGTTFVAEVKDSTKQVRLIRFVFNNDQTYILEFGNLYMRVHKLGVQLTTTAKTITGITKANPAVVTTSAAHGLATGAEVTISAVVGMTQVNGRNFKITNLTATTFSLQSMDGTNLNSTAFGTYTSGGQAAPVYEIVTPYVTADLARIQFIQSADVMTLVHPNYQQRELKRTGDTAWTITTPSFAPVITAPGTPTATYTGAAAAYNVYYVITAVSSTTEESVPSASGGASASYPITVNWSGVGGAASYNIYKSEQSGGPYGYVGSSNSTNYVDTGVTEDYTRGPTVSRNPFNSAGNYPSAAAYIQQRMMYANTTNGPETIWGSKSVLFHNYTISTPLQDDDAVTFTLVGRQVNEIRHLLDLGEFVVLTAGGEWAVQGDSSGVIKPTAINPKQHSYNGSSWLSPIVIDNNALYVQARGSVVRDLMFDFQSDGYRGTDLTIFSAHLVDGYQIADWAYQKIPNSIAWMARSDGSLIGLTYIREQAMFGWHRHDFDGTVENVACVPEGSEDCLYLVINRTVNGRQVRYLERMASRFVHNLVDYIGMDAALSYDGRNANTGFTMQITGGTTWGYQETLTLVSNLPVFSTADIGSEYHFVSSDGIDIRFLVTGYTDTTHVTGNANRTVPVTLQGLATSSWSKAISQISGLWHIEGKEASILGDGFVVSSPYNPSYNTLTVTNGMVTLDRPYSVIHAGLPYICDLETLDIDEPQQIVADKAKIPTRVTLFLEKSRGCFVGTKPPDDDTVDPLQGLTELKIRESEFYDDPVNLATGKKEINIKGNWNKNGRIFIRQVDPLPLSILAIIPSGMIPGGG